MVLKLSSVIRLTPYYAGLTGWPNHFGKVFAVLGFPTGSPTAKEFVTAVQKWQRGHAPLHSDGLLGPKTWEKLLPEVQAYRGNVAVGTRPDWVDPPRHQTRRGVTDAATDITPRRPASPPVLARAVSTPEDHVLQDLMKEWLSVAHKINADPFLAVPVSNAFATDEARLTALEPFPLDADQRP